MGKPAARLGDTTMHGSPLLGACCPTVLIGKKPAWRIGDQHTCPIPNAPPPACSGTPHGPGVTTPIPDGADGVCLIGGKPAARVGDIVMEPGALVPLPPPNTIVMGCPTVLIGMVGATTGGGAGDPNVCQTEGHPVDVVSGRVIQIAADIERMTPAPFVLRRFYSSTMTLSGDLGPGWRHNLELTLSAVGDAFTLTDEYGSASPLPRPQAGEIIRHGAVRVEGLGLNEYVIWRGPNEGLHFRANAPGRFHLIGIYDGPDVSCELSYDKSHRIAAVRDRCGRVFEFTYIGRRLMRVVERSCRDKSISRVCVEYAFDDDGYLNSAKDASGAALVYRYDHGLLVQETDRGGFSFYFQYDAARRCITTWGDGGLLYRQLEYNDQDNVTRVTDSRGASRFYFHNGGLVYRLTHGDGASKNFSYNDQGKVTAELDETDIGSLSEFDARGRQIKSVTPGGGVTEFVYDDADRLVEARASDGKVKQWLFGADGRLTQLVENGDVTCEWTYNAQGDLIRVRDALGYAVNYAYDECRRVKAIADDAGEVSILYDDFGNIREVREDDELLIACTYDVCNRLSQRGEPDGRGTRYAWNANGQLAAVEKPDGSRSRFEYRWQMRTAAHQASHATESSTWFDYDNEQNLLAIRLSQGTAYRFEWDLRSRRVARHEPSGRTVTFRHDPAGRVVEERCGPHSVRMEYDPAGNLAAVIGADDESVRYEYDAFCKLIRGASGPHENVLTYDERGRLIHEEADGESLDYRYDATGRRVTIEPSRGVAIGFAYAPSGSLQAITAGGRQLAQYRRDSRGRIVDTVFANGVVERRSWDECYRNRSWTIGRDGQTLRERSFDFDALSRLSAIRDIARGADEFHYSPFGSIDSQALAAATRVEQFQLDDQQNYLELPGGRRATYGPGDRLLDDGQYAYEYDGLGRTAARIDHRGERTLYHYDFRDLMTRIDHPDGRVTRYEYDAFGRRVLKDDAGRRTTYLWDGNQLLASWIASSEVRQFIMDPFRWIPVAQLEVRETATVPDIDAKYCHADHLGAITEMTCSTGDVVWSVRYDGLGKALQMEGSAAATPLRRPGQYFDDETGLYYNRYRYYDPSTARFTTPDPVDVQGGFNLYRYPGSTTTTLDLVGLSPTAMVDNNFLVSLFNADKMGLQSTAEMQAAQANKLGTSPTAYKEFTEGEGIGGREAEQRRKMLQRYGIKPIAVCGSEKKAYEQARQDYRRQGLSDNDADIAAHAKAKDLPLLSGDQRAYVNNNAFVQNSTQSVTNLGTDSRGAAVFQIILR